MIVFLSIIVFTFVGWVVFYGLDKFQEYRCKHRNLTEKFMKDGWVCDDCGKRFDIHPGGEGSEPSAGKSAEKKP